MEEEAARRFVVDQTRQLAQGDRDKGSQDVGADLQHRPKVNYTQSSEEQAILREQVIIHFLSETGFIVHAHTK
jgi:hypothetical protein